MPNTEASMAWASFRALSSSSLSLSELQFLYIIRPSLFSDSIHPLRIDFSKKCKN